MGQKGSHPETLGEMKDAEACFNYSGNDCYWSNSIKIYLINLVVLWVIVQ